MDLIRNIWNFSTVFKKEEHMQHTEENLQPVEDNLQLSEDIFQPKEEFMELTGEILQPTEERLHSTEDKLHPTEKNLQPSKDKLKSTEDKLQPAEEKSPEISCNICDASLKNLESLNKHYLKHVNNKTCRVNLEKLNASDFDKLINKDGAQENINYDFDEYKNSMEGTNSDNYKTDILHHNKSKPSNIIVFKESFETKLEVEKDNYTVINNTSSNGISIKMTIKKEPKIKRKKIYHVAADNKEETSKDSVNIFPCHVCQDLFDSTKSLTLHIKTLHPNIEKGTCGMCQKKFKNITILIMHTRKHLGIRPFSCDGCRKSFCNAKYLSEHKSKCKKVLSHNPKDNFASKINHTVAGSCPCNVCRQAFENFGDLRRHVELLHPELMDNLICTICQKKSARFDSFMDHTRRHFNIRPYACAKCGAEFHTRPNINQHIKSCQKSVTNEDFKDVDSFESDIFQDILEALPPTKEIVYI